MKLPINRTKFDSSDDRNAIVYTLDNLAVRGIQPQMIEATWGKIWRTEYCLNLFEEGHSVEDIVETNNHSGEILTSVFDVLVEWGCILKELKDEIFNYDKSINTLSISVDIFQNEIDKPGVQRKATTKAFEEFTKHSEPLDFSEYWDSISQYVFLAAKNFKATGTLMVEIQRRNEYQKHLSAILFPMFREVNSMYFYNYSTYRHNDGYIIVHCCCNNGNHVVEIYPDGKIYFPFCDIKGTGGKQIFQNIMSLEKSNQEFIIHDKMHMPYDLSHMVNDYDSLFVRYSGAS